MATLWCSSPTEPANNTMDRPRYQKARQGESLRIVEHLLSAINAHDLPGITLLYASDYQGLDVSRALPCRGTDGVQATLNDWWRAFPDLAVTAHPVWVHQTRIAFYWTACGTHQGAFLNIPPTHKHITLCGFSMLTLRDNLIAEGLHLWDVAGMLRAMSLLPELPGVPESAGQSTLLTAFLSETRDCILPHNHSTK